MATIRTVLGKIKVKETVSEIFDQNNRKRTKHKPRNLLITKNSGTLW